jgi:hypothetical protein
MKKLLVIFISGICVFAAVIGLIQKRTYTNITANERVLDYFKVAVLVDDMVPLESFKEIFSEDSFILHVKSEGEVEYLFGAKKQYVTVQKVYKGDDIKVGDKIAVAGSAPLNFDDMTASMVFVNNMKKDNEYLVFLEEKIDTLEGDRIPTYRIPSYSLTPIFNYEDKEHNIITVNEEIKYVPYSDVSQNEFFVDTEEVLEELLEFKHELLSLYPK